MGTRHVSAMALEVEYSLRYFPNAETLRAGFAPDAGLSLADTIEVRRNKLIELFMRMFLRESDVFPLGPRFGFMANGGRSYLDRQIFEMATAECSNPRDVARYHIANEALLIPQIAAMYERRARGGLPCFPGGRIEISKKTSDFRGDDSYGCHENYQMRRFEPKSAELFRETRRRLLQPFTPFLISRQPFIGAGNLTNGGEFVVSPRGTMTNTVIVGSAGRANGRTPLAFIRRDGDVNTERSSSSDVCEADYARLQVCCSDGNVSGRQTEFKLGTTAIVLRMIEEGYLAAPPVRLADRREAMRAVARDTTLTERLPTRSGDAVTALELSRLYFLKARRFFETHPMHGWEAGIMALWEEWLRKLARNPAALDTILDWRILFRFVESELERKFRLTLRELKEKLEDPDDEESRNAALPILRALQWKILNYFFIFDARFREALVALGVMDEGLLSPQGMVGAAECLVPPADTRASWRSWLMRFFRSRGMESSVLNVGWGLIQFLDSSQSLVQLTNEDPRNASYCAERNAPLSDELLLSIVNR